MPVRTKKLPTRKLPFVLLLFFVAAVVLGINFGELGAVFEKAVTICLDCIGIG